MRHLVLRSASILFYAILHSPQKRLNFNKNTKNIHTHLEHGKFTR